MSTRKKSLATWAAQAFASAVVLAGMCSLAQGGVILAVTGGGLYDDVGSEAVGQSFTTPSGGPWHDITFNFFSDVPALTPLASGNAFLLTQEYLGTPGGLSTATPGFLAESTGLMAVNGGDVWVFASNIVLNPNTQYWIYEDTPIFITGASNGGGPSQESYFTFSTGSYSPCTDCDGADPASNFELDGSAVPEPGTWLTGLSGLGIVALTAIRRRSGSRKNTRS